MRIGSDPSLQDFDRWLLKLGNGTLPIVKPPDKVSIAEDFLFEIDDTSRQLIKESLKRFIGLIFPDINNMFTSSSDEWINWVSKRAILAPKNSMVDEINSIVADCLPNVPTHVTSADSTTNVDDITRFPTEFLNSLTPAGLPPHHLYLKVGMVLMVIRNLNPTSGLCNGTRVILNHISSLLLTCTIATGDHAAEQFFIPRIEMLTNENDLQHFPIAWKRRQFPVRPAFAMTINKSQGQTLKRVGIWLEEPVFTHGQLYVAASRVGNPEHLTIAVPKSHVDVTRNVVYNEILDIL